MVSDQGPCIQSIHSAETAGLPYRRDEHLHAYTRSIRQRLLGYPTAVVSTCMSAETAGLPVPPSRAKCCMRRARAPPRTSRVWLCECARIRVTTMRCGACGGGGRARARAPDDASSGAARANARDRQDGKSAHAAHHPSLSQKKIQSIREKQIRRQTGDCASRTGSTPTSDATRRDCPRATLRTHSTVSGRPQLRIETLSEHDRRTAAVGARRRYVQNRRESRMTACDWQYA